MLMKIYLETNRLIYREFVAEDLDNMFALDSDPLVHKYLGIRERVFSWGY